jgi:hypothetical protein
VMSFLISSSGERSAVRRGIFVEFETKIISGSAGAEYASPDGAGDSLWRGFLQRFRSYGAEQRESKII